MREIAAKLGLTSDFYIGLNDIDNENSWVWQSTNTALEPLDGIWDQGEPNNLGEEHCASVRPYHQFKLNDLSCRTKLPIVCQK